MPAWPRPLTRTYQLSRVDKAAEDDHRLASFY
jgi:hypothetical protein